MIINVLTYGMLSFGVLIFLVLSALLFGEECGKLSEKLKTRTRERLRQYNIWLVNQIYVPGKLYSTARHTIWSDKSEDRDFPDYVEVERGSTALILEVKVTEPKDYSVLIQITALVNERTLTLDESISKALWCDLLENDRGLKEARFVDKRSRWWFTHTRDLLPLGAKRFRGALPRPHLDE